MGKRSIFFVPNIVLGIILAIIIFVDCIVVLATNVVMSKVTDVTKQVGSSIFNGMEEIAEACENYGVQESIIVVETIFTQCLGTVYQEKEAESGYQYYSILVTVKNEGNQCAEFDYLPIECVGQQDYDMYNVYEEKDYDAPFYYEDIQIIPPGRSCQKEMIVQVKNGVKEINLILDPYSSIEGEQTLIVHLE